MTKSYISCYWKIWIGLVACLVLVRGTVFLRTERENVLFALFSCYAIPTWLAIVILNAVEGQRLMQFLKQNHHEKWKELTYVPGFGSGGVNSFRSLPFLYSKDSLADPVVAELKLNCRRFVNLMLTVFFTLPPLFIIVMLPWSR